MAKSLIRTLSMLATYSALATTAHGQNSPTDYRDEFLQHFEQSSMKIQRLSQTMPADLFTWSPGEGVMSVTKVYMHIARYNYMYLDEQLGIMAPPDVDWQNFESITEKERVVELLAASIEHVKAAAAHMSAEELTNETRLYGRDVPGWSVLFQLISHMNEHVVQSIAYARMNGIVPPWSS